MNVQVNEVDLTLSGDEAIVLFEMLKRLASERTPGLFGHPSEAQVLWTLHALLEEELIVQFSPEYPNIIGASRDRVLAAEDEE